ncbi:hypothetical protein IFR05_014714 [Cadophora sp. M221]|nr:hypothetical protein IFR05_014714 [Cadophora sp. M221]
MHAQPTSQAVPAARKPKDTTTLPTRAKRPIPKPVLSRHTPLHIQSRPAGAPRTADAEKALRRQVVQGLPKGRRPVIRNRIELFFPSDVVQFSASVVSNLEAVQDSDDASGSGRVVKRGFDRLAGERISREDEDRDECWANITGDPVAVLGAGRVDPFGNYPIRISPTEQWLLDEVHTNPTPLFRTFEKAWLPSAIHDSAMFHQLLANIAINVYTIQGRDSTNVVSMRHHASALNYINRIISDPEKGTSDGVMCSVGTFVCYSAYTENFTSLDMHLSGLERIVELRGGWKTFDRNETLRCQLFGVDLAGACRRDSKPRFPLPDYLIQETQTANYSHAIGPYGISPGLASCIGLFRHDTILLKAFHDLSIAIEHVNRKARLGEDWADIKFFIFWIDPIVHGLVGREFLVDEKALQELTRLGLLLLLSKTRRYCGQLGVSTRYFVGKLNNLLAGQNSFISGVSSEKVLLWAVFMGMFETKDENDGDWFIKKAASVAYKLGFWGWSDTLSAVQEFVWIQDVFDDETGRFRDRFDCVLGDLIVTDLSETVNGD